MIGRGSEMDKTCVTDITHYLDKDGELAEMPGPARKLASFLVLLIDATTQACPDGVIRNWRETKWDQRRQGAGP